MIVQPTNEFRIGHRAYLSTIAQARFGYLASAIKEEITYVDEQFVVRQVEGTWGRIYRSAILENNGRLAITHGKNLTVIDLQGRILFNQSVPENCKDNYFNEIFFDPFRDELWLSFAHSRERFEIRVLDTNSWEQVAGHVMDDPFSNSDQSFCPTYHAGFVGMYLTTGGCGEEFYILDRNEGGITIEDCEIGDSRDAVFSPNAKEFLVTEGHTAIGRYGYPAVGSYGETTGLYETIQEMSGDEESSVGSSIAYIDSNHALISDETELLAILELSSMTITSTVKVQLDKSMQSQLGEFSSWIDFERVHDQILFHQSGGQFFAVPVEQFLS